MQAVSELHSRGYVHGKLGRFSIVCARGLPPAPGLGGQASLDIEAAVAAVLELRFTLDGTQQPVSSARDLLHAAPSSAASDVCRSASSTPQVGHNIRTMQQHPNFCATACLQTHVNRPAPCLRLAEAPSPSCSRK